MRYVGLDVHKTTVRVCILSPSGRRLLGKTIPCSRESLVEFAQSQLKADDLVALEALYQAHAL